MGFDKTHILFRGQTFLTNAIDLMRDYTNDIVISSNTNLTTDLSVYADEIQNIGPMGGIYTCLKKIKHSKALIMAADMPLINHKIIDSLIINTDKNSEISIFKAQNRLQMLVGMYDQKILPLLDNQIAQKDYKLNHLLDNTQHQIIDAKQFEDKFININSPDEWHKLKEEYGL